MANQEHLKILRQGVDVWNKWRRDHPYEMPNLKEAVVNRTYLSGANLTGVDLTQADLSKANLDEADFRRANLSQVDLSEAFIREADFHGANLTNANLRSAVLNGANMTGADLSGTDLRGADLLYVDLSNAILRRAIGRAAKFGYTILANVDLSSITELDLALHYGPSSLGVDTLYRSNGAIPEPFLRGVGLTDTFIRALPSLLEESDMYYGAFISYSHKDQLFARRLYKALQDRGISCWLDEHEIKAGQKINVEVDRGIQLSAKVLLCCSKASLTSWWVEHEIELAIQKEQRLYKERGQEVLSLIPLNLDGYMFSDEWESSWKGQITSRLAPNFTGWLRSHKKFEAQLERVVKALRADAGARGVVPPRRL